MKVACVLITHLPVKSELVRRPELARRPVIITETAGSKQRVLDSSPEARGVVAGMSLQEALSRCKEAVLVEADAPHYREAFDGLLSSLEQRSPLVEKSDLGCAYVGLDGLEAMYGGEPRLITTLMQAIPNSFNPRIGLAKGKFPAYVAAVTSDAGQATRVPDDGARFLKDFSVELLPLSWENKVRLHRFGLHTLGQVAELSLGSMQAQFGQEGRAAWQLANGIDGNHLLPYQREEIVTDFLTFPAPTITSQSLLAGIETLLGRTFARAEVRGKYVRSIILESQILRHTPWLRFFPFKDAVGSKDKAFFVMKSALESVVLPGPLEDMKLTLAGLTGESGIQTSLFSDTRKRAQLREAVRQLEAQLGRKPPIYQVRDLEPWSNIPERRQALIQFDP